MAEDASYQPGVYRDQGGNKLTVGAAGAIELETGAEFIVGDNDIVSDLAALNGLAAELALLDGYTGTTAQLNFLSGVTAGTAAASKAVVVDSSKNIATLGTVGCGAITSTGSSSFASVSASGTIDQTAGAAAAAVAQRFGASATEGLEIKVIDETVSGFTAAKTFDLTEDIPSGAVILSVQANIETLVVAGGTSVKVGIGVAGGDVDKYGLSADLLQNTKIDTIPDWAVLGGAEDVQIGILTSDGSALGDTNASAGAVRVRIVYALPNSLDNA